jgi:hypothetical protein
MYQKKKGKTNLLGEYIVPRGDIMYCTNCGTKASESGKFCKECGAQVGDQVSSTIDKNVISYENNVFLKDPFKPATILIWGILLGPLVSGILASINLKRFGIEGLTKWALITTITGFASLMMLLSYLPENYLLLSWLIAAVITIIIYIYGKGIYKRYMQDAVIDGYSIKNIKKNILTILFISLVVISIFLITFKPSVPEIEFGKGGNDFGVTNTSTEFNRNSPVFMEVDFGKPIGSSRVEVFLVKITENSGERILFSWYVGIDPTWDNIIYELNQGGMFVGVERGDYILRIFNDNDLVAEGNFTLK